MFGDFLASDLKSLRRNLGFTYDVSFKNFDRNELIFEIGEVINLNLLSEFEAVLRSKLLESEWNISAFLSSGSGNGLNNTKKFLLDRIEKAHWKKSLKFTTFEKSMIKKMFSLDRGV